tara:strand:+ start:41528 stop:42418 length:891 start_codon:yes stop_codon:yes gene_type:complete
MYILLMKRLTTSFILSISVALSACSQVGSILDPKVIDPQLTKATGVGLQLTDLPPPARPIDIAVYAFEDKTGQQKPTEGFSSFSKAVGQGSDAILIDVLKDVSDSKWFNVIERGGIQNLLNERNLIDQTNRSYLNTQRSSLPPLRFAGIILEGGVVNYDSNVLTSGVGARLLGIGSLSEYRRDEVTVALRAVSVNTGEVLVSTTAEKVVYSTLLRGDVFKFVSSDQLLEIEAGFSRNEPVGLAVRQAIELAVLSLIVDGAQSGLWQFANKTDQQNVMNTYHLKYKAPRAEPALGPV